MLSSTHLYQNFLTDRRVYNLNRAYWKKMLTKAGESLSMPLYNEHYANGTAFYDGNPMISAYAPHLKKSVRIIQEEAETDTLEIGAWTEQKEFENEKIQELVICLELSKEASKIAKKLILGWLTQGWDQHKIEEEMEKIHA